MRIDLYYDFNDDYFDNGYYKHYVHYMEHIQ